MMPNIFNMANKTSYMNNYLNSVYMYMDQPITLMTRGCQGRVHWKSCTKNS